MNKYIQVFKKKFISWIFQNNPYTFNRISWNLFLFSLVLTVRLGYQRRYISNFVSFKAPRFSNIGKQNARTIKFSEQRAVMHILMGVNRFKLHPQRCGGLLMFCSRSGWTFRDGLYGIANQSIDHGLGLDKPIGILIPFL
jgi:hypothetical protein